MGVPSSLRASNGVLQASIRRKFLPFFCIGWRGLSVSRTNSVTVDGVLPVLIVGAGPVGLILSMLLTKLGVDCAILEKNKTFSNHPQAHFINNRSMEIFRKLDGLAEEIQRLEPPVDLWRKFVYCTSLTGSVLGTVDHMQPQDFEKVVSPVSVAHFSQHKLTRLLVNRVKNLNFQIRNPEGLDSLLQTKGGDILMGHEFVSIDTSPDRCLNVTASSVEGGEYRERNICCRILVGADGAGSTVRKHAGIRLTGEKDLQKLVSVHFLSKDLGQYLLNHRPGMLYFVFNVEAIGVLVAHDLKQGEFVLQIPFYPPQQDIKDFSPEICEEVILKLVGHEIGDIDVIGIKPWVMHAEVAEKYVCSDNRVVLAGDAAHRFPPAGGFGMNTGIQDAHNLAWKLASILKGISPPSYLQTYEAERRPIALFNTALSVQNFRAAMAVPSALGLDPQIANSVHRVVNDGIGSILPSGAQKLLLNGIFSIGRSQLSQVLLNENNPLGSSRLEALKQIFHEGKSLQLQFPAEDLGFRYREGAIIHDSDGASMDPEAPTGRRRDYIPSSDPGGRLPHMNVRVLSNNSPEGLISTLDLITGDKIEFLLIIAPIDSSYNLARAVLKVSEELNVSAKVCVMWPHGFGNRSEAKTKEALVPWRNYIDVEVDRTWWSICQMDETGAVLVRPDEHIAWRTRTGVIRDPVSEMKIVFNTILGL